jgi:hypothetical protein
VDVDLAVGDWTEYIVDLFDFKDLQVELRGSVFHVVVLAVAAVVCDLSIFRSLLERI